MPEIVFKGKEYVYNHHLTVPYRPLVADKAKGVGSGDLNSSLVIHGDNLHALKALLPRYAGKVDLVFIDPPYNTGNEGWCYSDGVNSPIMKEWLSTNPVDGEDMLRHDKWLCMMWPRLVLLRELLSERGSIWITLDDNEVHRARMALDEIFGEKNFIGTMIWRKKEGGGQTDTVFVTEHDYLIGYAKDRTTSFVWVDEEVEVEESEFKYLTTDGQKCAHVRLEKWGSEAHAEDREGMSFPIADEHGNLYAPIAPDGLPGRWRVGSATMDRLISNRLIIWKDSKGRRVPYEIVRFVPGKTKKTKERSLLLDAGSSTTATNLLTEMFGEKGVFDTPKPLELVEMLTRHCAYDDSIVLDSFAGSGTTAHAVLKANARDNGHRKFILVEGEDYADRLTAERVRRAIKGYAWLGTQRETLLEEKITWKQFQKAGDWLAKVETIKAREGFAEGDLADQGTAAQKRFDKINVELKDGVLRVVGEKKVSERAEGLGGEFTYCTLGEPLSIEKLLSGENLPTFEALGAWLFHTATGGTLPPAPKKAPEFYLGEAKDAHVWLVYEPRLTFLKSAQAALNLSLAQRIVEWGAHKADGKKHLVFAPAKYMSNKQLAEHRIDFASLPFALLRGM